MTTMHTYKSLTQVNPIIQNIVQEWILANLHEWNMNGYLEGEGKEHVQLKTNLFKERKKVISSMMGEPYLGG